MKKQLILIPLLLLSLLVTAQGIKFEEHLSWAQVKSKARKEHKNIFIDFMATWCVPCKAMDQKTYVQEDVGNAVNSDFIAVKVQQDKTPGDNEFIKSWYDDAAELIKKYEVSAYPTMLFVTPNGSVLHKGSGFMTPDVFLNLVKEAKDPSKQYVLLTALQDLLRKASLLKEPELEKQLAQTYIDQYLSKKPKDEWYSKSNLQFLSQYVTPASEGTFKVFFPDASKAAGILSDKNIQANVMSRVISQEIIDPALFKDDTHNVPKNLQPNWAEIAAQIEKAYGIKYVKDNIFNAKVGWYFYSPWKDYNEAAKAFIDYYGKNGRYVGDPNTVCWDLFFTHINDKEMLKIAAGWMRNTLTDVSRPEDLDTYANLLYKIGNKDEAIKWQTKAINSEVELGKKRGDGQVRSEFSETLTKMKAGIKTWSN